jgi:hypothetical protein
MQAEHSTGMNTHRTTALVIAQPSATHKTFVLHHPSPAMCEQNAPVQHSLWQMKAAGLAQSKYLRGVGGQNQQNAQQH